MANPKLIATASIVHVLSLSLWFGGGVFFSFVSAPRVFAQLGRELLARPVPGLTGVTAEIGNRLAGDVVGAVFPAYFVGQIIVGTLALTSGLVLSARTAQVGKLRLAIVGAALAIVLVHSLTIYPQSVRKLDEVYRVRDAGDSNKAAELRRTFSALHSVSQVLNLMTLTLAGVATGCVGAALPRGPND